jgi:ABC-type enterochelin transport system substrate-binding protein
VMSHCSLEAILQSWLGTLPGDAVLQDRKRKIPGQDSSAVEKEERPDWYSILDRTRAIGRLMLEDVYENHL